MACIDFDKQVDLKREGGRERGRERERERKRETKPVERAS